MAAVVLIGTGHATAWFADTDTIQAWLPALAGLLLAWLVPPQTPAPDPFADNRTRRQLVGTWILVAAAVVFTIGLLVAPLTDARFITLKLVLLLAIPLLLRLVTFSEWVRLSAHGRWLRPSAAVLGYLVVTTALDPSFQDVVPDALTIMAVFIINAVVEEIFYRFWLQTRLESRYGRWPAIAVTSVLFASWHAAVHTTGDLLIDLATAILNVGVMGIFLGYLWSRHRNPWLLILVHGFINAPLTMFAAMA